MTWRIVFDFCFTNTNNSSEKPNVKRKKTLLGDFFGFSFFLSVLPPTNHDCVFTSISTKPVYLWPASLHPQVQLQIGNPLTSFRGWRKENRGFWNGYYSAPEGATYVWQIPFGPWCLGSYFFSRWNHGTVDDGTSCDYLRQLCEE